MSPSKLIDEINYFDFVKKTKLFMNPKISDSWIRISWGNDLSPTVSPSGIYILSCTETIGATQVVAMVVPSQLGCLSTRLRNAPNFAGPKSRIKVKKILSLVYGNFIENSLSLVCESRYPPKIVRYFFSKMSVTFFSLLSGTATCNP